MSERNWVGVAVALCSALVLVGWVFGLFFDYTVGVVALLVAVPALVATVQLGWRQGRTSRVTFVSLQVVIPPVVGQLIQWGPYPRDGFSWAAQTGLAVGLVFGVGAVLVIKTSVFRRRPRVFINYRRVESTYVANQLYRRLCRRYSRSHVFLDVDTLELGQDFRHYIQNFINWCDALLVVIGPNWAQISDPERGRLLELPDDFVRQEVETAFAAGVPVIPVLVDGAALPAPAVLPPSLRQLPDLQAAQLRPGADFREDLRKLAARLEQARRARTAERSSRRGWWSGHKREIVALTLTFVVVVQLYVVLVVNELWDGIRPILSPDGRHIVSAMGPNTEEHALVLWRSADGEIAATAPAPAAAYSTLSWSPDSQRFVVGSADGQVRIWRADGLRPGAFLSGHVGAAMRFDWSPDGTRVAAVDDRGVLLVWDAVTGRQIARTEGSRQGILSDDVDWSPEHDRLVAFGSDSRLRVFELRGNTLNPVPLPKEYANVSAVAWSPNGDRLAVAAYEPVLLTFNGQTAPSAKDIARNGPPLQALSFSPDGQWIAGRTGGNNAAAYILSGDTGTEIGAANLTGPQGYVPDDSQLQWSSDSTKIVADSSEGWLQVFARDGTKLADLHSPDGTGFLVRWADDRINLLSAPVYRMRVSLWSTDLQAGWQVTTCRIPPWRAVA